MFRFIGASPESPAMFENRLFDFFSRTHWVSVPIVYVPLILLFAGYAGARESPLLLLLEFLLGSVAWTLLEYWLHRTVFHWTTGGEWAEKFHFLVHGVHHTFPKDRYRLVMPPVASLTLGLFIYGALTALNAGLQYMMEPLLMPEWVEGFFSGLMAGYVGYDLTHYYLHHGAVQGHWLPNLRRHHLYHHAVSNRKFGVSSTLWDNVFGSL